MLVLELNAQGWNSDKVPQIGYMSMNA